MDLATLLPLVAPQHRRQFRRFARTGQASQKFFRHLNRSHRCQIAIERLLRLQFEELAHLFGQRLDRSKL